MPQAVQVLQISLHAAKLGLTLLAPITVSVLIASFLSIHVMNHAPPPPQSHLSTVTPNTSSSSPATEESSQAPTRPTAPPHTSTSTPATSTTAQPTYRAFDCGPCRANLTADTIFVVQTSRGVGERGVQRGQQMMRDVLEKMSNSGSRAKVGVLAYDENVYVASPLGSVSEALANLNITLSNSPGNNLRRALEASLDMSSTYGLLVIKANTENLHGPKPAISMLNDMKTRSNVIVNECVDDDGSPSDALVDYPTPGYYVEGCSSSDFLEAMCDSECYCPSRTMFIPKSTRNVPSTGCYRPVPITSNFNGAARACAATGDGVIAICKSEVEDRFLHESYRQSKGAKVSEGTNSILIGLSYDTILGMFIWTNGEPLILGREDDYQPWGKDQPMQPTALGCVESVYDATNGNITWQTIDCREGRFYVCLQPPCSINYPCESSFSSASDPTQVN